VKAKTERERAAAERADEQKSTALCEAVLTFLRGAVGLRALDVGAFLNPDTDAMRWAARFEEAADRDRAPALLTSELGATDVEAEDHPIFGPLVHFLLPRHGGGADGPLLRAKRLKIEAGATLRELLEVEQLAVKTVMPGGGAPGKTTWFAPFTPCCQRSIDGSIAALGRVGATCIELVEAPDLGPTLMFCTAGSVQTTADRARLDIARTRSARLTKVTAAMTAWLADKGAPPRSVAVQTSREGLVGVVVAFADEAARDLAAEVFRDDGDWTDIGRPAPEEGGDVLLTASFARTPTGRRDEILTGGHGHGPN
jgi:hypothetical protein